MMKYPEIMRDNEMWWADIEVDGHKSARLKNDLENEHKVFDIRGMKYDRNNKVEMLVALSEVVSDSACSYNKFSLRKMLNRNWQLDARSPGMLKIVCYDKNAPGCKL